MKLNSTDLSAKLLATENISVRRARTQTASFDIVSRVLTLPMWKDMSPTIEGMLIGHEVGHALYTTEEYMEPMQENKHMQGYLNVLEDVRIEKLMKRSYPGIRKTMLQGYKELNDKDFFGVAKKDLSELLLIDRINLYFKAGYNCGVNFTPEEKTFVDRAERTETIQEVVDLARDLYAFTKEELEQKIREQEEQLELEGGSAEDFGDLDEIDEEFSGNIDSSDMDDTDETSEDDGFSDFDKQLPSTTSKETFEERVQRRLDEELEASTDKTFYKKLEESADQNTDYLSYTLDDNYAFNVVVPYKKVIQETYSNEYGTEVYDKFKTETSRIVNYLVKEFEMRKSAKMYKRSQISKSGSLDMRKVWAYKLNDDLFKRVTTVAQGKNHGMVFLLDWSGSMDDNLGHTLEQVITLAMFCQRTQIPYQVLAFSSQYSLTECYVPNNEGTVSIDEEALARSNMLRDKRNYLKENTSILSNAAIDFSLIEFLSSKMTNSEFNTMAMRLLNVWRFKQSKNNQYQTGGTPLNEALSYMFKHIPEFARANNVEKMTLITLTDGEGCGLQTGSRYGLDDYRIDTKEGYKKIQQKHFLQDPVTKKSYAFTRMGYEQSEVLIRMLKDRLDIRVLGFYICDNTRNRLNSAIRSNMPGYTGNTYTLIDHIRKDFRANGYYSIKGSGRDDLFLIPSSSLSIENAEIDVNQSLTAKQIAKQFTKAMTSRKTNRVLLNQFIGYVA